MKERAYDRFTPLAGVVSVVALIAGFALARTNRTQALRRPRRSPTGRRTLTRRC